MVILQKRQLYVSTFLGINLKKKLIGTFLSELTFFNLMFDKGGKGEVGSGCNLLAPARVLMSGCVYIYF